MPETNKPIMELGIEFVVEVLLFLYPYGADQMGLPHNFWFGLGCWMVGTAIAIRMFWIVPIWLGRLSSLGKGIIVTVLIGIYVLVFYKPVMVAYGKRNSEIDGKQNAQLSEPERIPIPNPSSEVPNPAIATKKKKRSHPKPELAPNLPVQEQQPIPALVPPPFITQNCPQGICTGGDNKGTQQVFNYGPPTRTLTAQQSTELSQTATIFPSDEKLDVLVDNTTEANNYGTSIYSALSSAGDKLLSGPTISLVPIHSGPNTASGTMICVSNYSQPTFLTAKKIAEILAENTPIKIWVNQCSGIKDNQIRVIIAAP